jgi:hypothetical protein
VIPWDTYARALITDATASNDANTDLYVNDSISGSIRPSSAGGRAVGLDTPPAMFANGTVSSGGPYDGIVTLNSVAPFQFPRPPAAGKFDAQRAIEHEIDEVPGLGSAINWTTDLRPQDLFSWSAPGQRNYTSSGTRYFSVDGGRTRIVDFNQNSTGDLGDWLSAPCPQAAPYRQNAIGCTGQLSDVTTTSPEGRNLDAIGYDLKDAPAAPPIDVNKDARTDFVFLRPDTQQTAVWYLSSAAFISGLYGPTVANGYQLIGPADLNINGYPDYILVNPATARTAIWYLHNNIFSAGRYAPNLPANWNLILP